MRHMVVIVTELTGYASIRHVAVSLPHVAALIGEKCMLPGDVKPPEGGTERRPRRARHPCARPAGAAVPDAEEMGRRLKARFDRQRQRAGLPPVGRDRDQGEVAQEPDELLAQD